MEAVECGPAALGIVLSHYGLHVPLEELRERCGVSRDGCKAGDILRASRDYGLQGNGSQMDIAALAKIPAPAILFWDFYHFVVWEGFGSRFGRPVAYVNDPAGGPRRLSGAEFDGSFTGIVLRLAPGPQFRRGGRRPTAWGGLRQRLRGVFPALVVALVAALLAVVVGLATPGFTRAFIDSVLVGPGGGGTVPLLLGMAVALVTLTGLVSVQESHLLRARVSAATLTSGRFLRHLLRLPIQFFHQRNPADLSRRLDSNESVTATSVDSSIAAATSVVVLAVYASLLWAYDSRLTLFGLATVAANVLLVLMVIRVRADGTAQSWVASARVTSVSYSGLQLIETMKATGAEDGYFRRWAGLHARLLTGRQQVEVPVGLLNAMASALSVFSGGLLLMIGALGVVQGALTLGVLVAFTTLVREVERPVSTLISLGPQVQDISTDVTRLRDVENSREDAVFARPQRAGARRLTGAVSMQEVSFGYRRRAEPVLRDLSFALLPGQQIAIVGSSGSGKSTVSRLLTGLYPAWSGMIAFDGEPIDRLGRDVLTASVAFVDQEIHLFAGSVRDNVRLWDPTIGDAAVVTALRDAELYDAVARRAGGLDSPVEQEGRNFSGGQRQRLEIARALVRDPAVLVLDEASSALDAETEYAINANLRRRGCTRVVIAHRLSTIRDSDEILVLDDGLVVERGTHEQLLANGGRYARLSARTAR